MHTTLRPRPKIMSVWRTILVCLTLIPAFLCSFLFAPGSLFWMVFSGIWVVLFLFFYLYYLPVRFRNLSLSLEGDQFVLTAGVFNRMMRRVPLQNIQFATSQSSPVHRLWKLCSVVMVSPGGRLRMPGLDEKDAKLLLELIFGPGC